MAHERIDVLDRGAEARAIAPRSRGAAVAAGVPCEHREIRQLELVDDVLQAAGVLVSPMEEDDRTLGLSGRGRPIPVEELGAVVAGEFLFLRGARQRQPASWQGHGAPD